MRFLAKLYALEHNEIFNNTRQNSLKEYRREWFRVCESHQRIAGSALFLKGNALPRISARTGGGGLQYNQIVYDQYYATLNSSNYAVVISSPYATPLANVCLPRSSPWGLRLQSFTPPFQSAIRPSLTPTRTTLTSSPSI